MGKRFLVEVFFFPSIETGRERIFYNKYCPAFEIKPKEFFSGRLIFSGTEEANTGEVINGEVQFLHEDILAPKLEIGSRFDFYEGPIKFGSILIKEIKFDSDS